MKLAKVHTVKEHVEGAESDSRINGQKRVNRGAKLRGQ